MLQLVNIIDLEKTLSFKTDYLKSLKLIKKVNRIYKINI